MSDGSATLRIKITEPSASVVFIIPSHLSNQAEPDPTPPPSPNHTSHKVAQVILSKPSLLAVAATPPRRFSFTDKKSEPVPPSPEKKKDEQKSTRTPRKSLFQQSALQMFSKNTSS